MRHITLIVMLAASFVAPAHAADCAAMAAGSAALAAAETVTTTPGKGPVAATLAITPGAHATITETRPGGAVSVIEYADGELTARTDRATGRHVTFVQSDVVGDIHASAPGAKSGYTVAILSDGAEVSRTRFERTIIGPGVRKISGCAFAVIRRRLAGVNQATWRKIGSESDDSPALGIPLWSRATFETDNGEFVNETAMTGIAVAR